MTKFIVFWYCRKLFKYKLCLTLILPFNFQLLHWNFKNSKTLIRIFLWNFHLCSIYGRPKQKPKCSWKENMSDNVLFATLSGNYNPSHSVYRMFMEMCISSRAENSLQWHGVRVIFTDFLLQKHDISLKLYFGWV